MLVKTAAVTTTTMDSMTTKMTTTMTTAFSMNSKLN